MWSVLLKPGVSQETHTNLMKTRQHAKKLGGAFSLPLVLPQAQVTPACLAKCDFGLPPLYFLPGCFAKNYYKTNYSVCVELSQKPCFLDLRVFAGVVRIFAGWLRGVLVVVFCFLEILGKSASHRKNISGVTESDRIPNPNALYSIQTSNLKKC
jgi:hypothetical protein